MVTLRRNLSSIYLKRCLYTAVHTHPHTLSPPEHGCEIAAENKEKGHPESMNKFKEPGEESAAYIPVLPVRHKWNGCMQNDAE
jgi:hypothetical protein